jgi:hypothetical protein
VIILDSLLVGGLRFVLDKVVTAVEAEMDDEKTLKEDLLAAQMRLELGEMSDEEFTEIERDILARLREIRDRDREGESGAVSLGSGRFDVDVRFGGDED